MATKYAKVTDTAAGASQDPDEIQTDAALVAGVTAVPIGLSRGAATEPGASGTGGTTTTPDFGMAGGQVTIDDAVYSDAGDGSISVSSRFDPGNYTAQDYRNEAKVAKAQGGMSGATASGTLTVDTNPSNGDTMTLDAKVYTFQTVLTDVDGHILIGATVAATQANIRNAVAAQGGTVGTDYAASMVAHATVRLEPFASNVAPVKAIQPGSAGDNIATTETFTAVTNVFGAAVLSGGTDITTSRTSLAPIGTSADVALIV